MWTYHTGFEIVLLDEDTGPETHYFETEESLIKGLVLICESAQNEFLSYNKHAQLCVCRSIKDACDFFEHASYNTIVDSISINIYLDNVPKKYNCDYYITNSLDVQKRIRKELIEKINANKIKFPEFSKCIEDLEDGDSAEEAESDDNDEGSEDGDNAKKDENNRSSEAAEAAEAAESESSDEEQDANYRCNDYTFVDHGKKYMPHEIVNSEFRAKYDEMLHIKTLINQPPEKWIMHMKELDDILLVGTPEKNKEIINAFEKIIKRGTP